MEDQRRSARRLGERDCDALKQHRALIVEPLRDVGNTADRGSPLVLELRFVLPDLPGGHGSLGDAHSLRDLGLSQACPLPGGDHHASQRVFRHS